jgi:uncharacterized protein
MAKKKKIKDIQIKDINIRLRFVIISIMIILAILIFLNFLTPSSVPENQDNQFNNILDQQEQQGTENSLEENFFSIKNSTRIKMSIPAVNEQGQGVNTILIVEATPGTGRTLTDIDNLLFWADTQHSIRKARRVAENITGEKMEDYDIIYSIEADASVIGGPSAGAALTIATIAALQDKKPNTDVMITGIINHDGTIGPVSEILEKAKAAKQQGTEIMLVPLLQSRDVVYITKEHCEVFGNNKICTKETKPKKVSIEEEVDIKVIEVETIQKTIGYFFNQTKNY